MVLSIKLQTKHTDSPPTAHTKQFYVELHFTAKTRVNNI